jgi:hypothetical protein
MTDIEFNEAIEAATGKKIGVDYGFAFGTQAPYNVEGGALSANMRPGYTVWKTTPDWSVVNQVEKQFTGTTYEQNLQDVINFLNE